ncbi:NAD(P)/FAD-dependent oxidoreductase [Actinoplanes sp. L3-i22]|uniref:FAD-dependent oxidoreductase n=1 Tax=Actinoplanes sp. L3-i22 TaxID=2836373 RepID=UPI001C772AD4|nr:NAD(P)/FAD-dependent oxidoreductase [Actinoplanes sp. L3-i22]BCY13220.1 monooxygenase [Actinoplanes sp. L3-i22]
MTAISIIGAGPGGLTCARILQRHGIPVTVYDRDPHRAARNQGGTLDLHADDGQIALREAGLLDEFFRLARPEGQEMRQYSSVGELRSHHLPAPDELFKPEIDRGQLRDLLLDSLEPGTVKWGHALASTDGHVLNFKTGDAVETELVIGADGAFSRVRPVLSPAVPQYTGVSFLEAWFDDVDNRHAEIAALVGQGGAHAADGERGLFAQRNSGGHIRVYIIRRNPADVTGLSTEELRAGLLAEFAGWSPGLRQLVSDNDGAYVDRPIMVLPVEHTWAHRPGVTLLGDAAHLMPPLGVGVNMAMLDASDLALALVGAATLDEGVRAYESIMLPRSAEIAKMLDGRAADLLDTDIPDFGEQ